MDHTAVSLVVPMRNEEGSLERLIVSIRAQTRSPDEVVLVDGGSTDRTVRLAGELTQDNPRFHILEAGEATPGRGRNVGAAASRHPWIAFTDAGIELEPTWLERLVAVVEQDPGVDVVYGNYEPYVGGLFEQWAALAYVPAPRQRPGGQMRGPFIASALLRRDVWEADGGFPDLRAAEDLIFMEKVEARGFEIGWAPTATVWWQLQPTLGRTFRKFALYSRHNVWAGRQRNWHYGIARKYLAAVPFLGLALLHSPLWLGVPAVGAVARVAKSLWQRREGRGVLWLLNPIQFAGVGIILATIDLATFIGWAQAVARRQSAPLTTVQAGQHR